MKANRSPESTILLLILIPLSLAILFVVIEFAYMVQGKSIVFLDLMSKFGYDFRDFHWAGRYFLQGKNPWSWERFVTPPLSVFFVLPFSELPAKLAVQIFFVLNALCVVIGAFLFYGTFIDRKAIAGGRLIVLISILFSYPVFFLLQRGNIDGIVFFLIALGLYIASRSQSMQADLFGALCFAIACHLKVYPVLLVVPIFIARRWRLLIFFLIGLIGLALLTPGMWIDFYQKLLIRQSGFKMEENGSLVNTALLLSVLLNYLIGKPGSFHNFIYIQGIAYLVFFAFLGLNLVADFRQRIWERTDCFAQNVIMYLPFLVCLPVTVFHYEFVILLALVPLVLRLAGSQQTSKIPVYLMAFGVILSQVHAGALYFLTDDMLAYYIPGLGLLLILISILSIKLRKRKIDGTPDLALP